MIDMLGTPQVERGLLTLHHDGDPGGQAAGAQLTGRETVMSSSSMTTVSPLAPSVHAAEVTKVTKTVTDRHPL